MDVIRPPLLWIDDRCYRQNIVTQLNDDEEVGNINIGVKNDFSSEGDDVCELDDIDITDLGDNRYMTSVEIPSTLCGIVIGKGGAAKKRLESETRTKITLPGRDEEGVTNIVGRCKSDVISARNRIEIILNTARQKQKPTHFISIPILSSEIKQNFAKFKAEVLETCGKERGVCPALFQDCDKLHVTVGTMVLLNDSERRRAAKALNECGDKIIRPLLAGKRLLVKMCGIEYMNDDPAEVNVLYAKVSCVEGPAGLLQRLANDVVFEFAKQGLMTKSYESVKLHATLMNTKFTRDSFRSQADSSASRTFNANKVIESFKDFWFGECNVPAIHLSQLHSKGSDGYYKETAKVFVN